MRHLALKGTAFCGTAKVGEELVVSPLETNCPLCLRIWDMLRMTPEKQKRIDAAREQIRRGECEEL